MIGYSMIGVHLLRNESSHFGLIFPPTHQTLGKLESSSSSSSFIIIIRIIIFDNLSGPQMCIAPGVEADRYIQIVVRCFLSVPIGFSLRSYWFFDCWLHSKCCCLAFYLYWQTPSLISEIHLNHLNGG